MPGAHPPLRLIPGGGEGSSGAARPALRLVVSLREERGQAAVEFVAIVPLVIVILALAYQALLAGQAVWQARVAPRAAARANAFGADAAEAARAHLPARLERGLIVDADPNGDV